MKLEQAKALFFAQYLGQQFTVANPKGYGFELTEVFTNHATNIHGALFDDDFETDFSSDDCTLLLRSVSQLTDEEAVNLAYLAMYHPSIEDYSISEVWIGEGDVRPNGGTWLEIGCRCWVGELGIEPDGHMFIVEEDSEKEDAIYEPVKCIDYLRSIGILLPFTYLNEENKPITLQPDEIIKMGWAKYQE